MSDYTEFLKAALAEDIGTGDITCKLTVPEKANAAFSINCREDITVAGLVLAKEVFHLVDASLKITLHSNDGNREKAGTTLLSGTGNARAILTAERTALNLLMHLSGIATLTARYVEAIEGTKATILDTRKTLPGMRLLQKYAITCGGGKNHRMRLDDGILIKDNHIALNGGNIASVIAKAKAIAPKGILVEVECDTLAQVSAALDAKADILLLDNMNTKALKEAVAINQGRAKLEASGGVNLDTVRAIAQTGVDYISIGRLTHSAPAVDIGLDM